MNNSTLFFQSLICLVVGSYRCESTTPSSPHPLSSSPLYSSLCFPFIVSATCKHACVCVCFSSVCPMSPCIFIVCLLSHSLLSKKPLRYLHAFPRPSPQQRYSRALCSLFIIIICMGFRIGVYTHAP